MQNLIVDLGERSYPISIGDGILEDQDFWRETIASGKVAIVTNDVVGPLYGERLTHMLRTLGKEVVTITLPDGESHKTLATIEHILDLLLESAFDRTSTLIALGGGVVGDMAGFAAAIYQRGVNFVQVPTTLMAMVDSSVGGKTGVNHRLGKNMIGAFHQPIAVLIDTKTLDTLADREYRSGISEVIKYGLIGDQNFFSYMEENVDKVLHRDPDVLRKIIGRSCEIKANVVKKDEKESGMRALLNLGHTFGHAIESAAGYGTYLHGEAVAIGMIMAADLSRRLDMILESEQARIHRLFELYQLPTTAPYMDVQTYVDFMKVDKKVQDGQLRLVLLNRIGRGVLSRNVPMAAIEQAIRAHMHSK